MNIRISQNAITASLTVWLTACGSLNLQVDVLDPSYVDTVLLRQDLFIQLQEALDESQPTETSLKGLQKEHRNAYQKIAEVYTKEAGSDDDGNAIFLRELANRLVPDFDGSVAPEYEAVISLITAVDAKIREVLGRKKITGPGDIDINDADVTPLLLKRLTVLRNFRGRVSADLKIARNTHAKGPEIAPAVKAIAGVALAQVQLKLDSLTGGQRLAEDPLAYAVASAGKQYWANKFNRTYGNGRFGNLNFAIKMESLAEFTIKGLTFDPSAVTAMASKVSAQSLIFAAQIAGVPVNLPNVTAGTSGQAAVDRSKALADMQTATLQQDAEIESRQRALIRIAERILSEADNILSNDKRVRDSTKDAIDASFEAQRPLLIPASGSNKGGT